MEGSGAGNDGSNYSYILSNDSYSLECRCESVQGTLYDVFLEPYFRWIDLLAYAFLPFLIMAICTWLITRVLFLSNKRLNKKKAVDNKSNTINTNKNSNNETLLLNRKQTNQRANKAKHLTYTLITLNCLFFCLVSPLVICLIVLTGQEQYFKILLNIVYLLAYSNHSFNFVLYGVSSPPFREALFKLFNINPSGLNKNYQDRNNNNKAISSFIIKKKKSSALNNNNSNTLNTTTTKVKTSALNNNLKINQDEGSVEQK
jgi:hypothetical protein